MNTVPERSSPLLERPPALPLRLGIVGCGAIAEMAHIPASRRVEEVRLAALIDSDVGHAQELATRLGVPRAGARLDDLVGAVDAVILSTPPHVRCGLARQALERGFHVLCEKPMGISSTECRQVIATARAHKRTLAVAHTYRFFPNWSHGRTLVRAGRLGPLVEARIEQGDPFSWPSRTVYTLRKSWVPGGVLFNEGVHVLDLLFWWFGPPAGFEYRDDAVGGLESNVRLTLHYPDGGAAHVRLSRTCGLSNSVQMRFARGTLAFPVYEMATLTLGLNGKTERLTLYDQAWDFVAAAAMQLQDFIGAVVEGRPPVASGEDGMNVVGFVEECYRQAARRPRPARTPPPGVTW